MSRTRWISRLSQDTKQPVGYLSKKGGRNVTLDTRADDPGWLRPGVAWLGPAIPDGDGHNKDRLLHKLLFLWGICGGVVCGVYWGGDVRTDQAEA